MATSYTTKAVTIGDITVTVSKKKDATAGERLKALLEFIADRIPHPDQGLPGGGGRPTHPISPGGPPPRPDQGLPPSGGRPPPKPDQGLPGQPPKPDQGLPGQPPKPDQGLPGDQPGVDNSLPGDWLRDHVDEIVKIVLNKCVDCKPEAGPK